jgi:RNA polymerase sigma-70 factor (sigma-E family)
MTTTTTGWGPDVSASSPSGDEALATLYAQHYQSLLRLAALLLDDVAACEDVAQEAYIRVHAAQGRLRDPDKALAYLRQTVVNLSRSALRRRLVALRHAPKPMPDAASAEHEAYAAVERAEVVQALRGLQRRQREAIVLRYYADLSEAQTAESMGVSVGAVKAYTSRGLTALGARLEGLR